MTSVPGRREYTSGGSAPRPVAQPFVLRSALLERAGLPHGFTTRLGGVSAGPFASLNFGNPGELPPDRRDPAANIHENFRLLQQELGVPGRELAQVHQVHGGVVHTLRPGRSTHAEGQTTKADALVSDDPSRLLAVRVADCAPVLLCSRDGRVVAAVHAGWRGVVAGVVPAALGAVLALAGQAANADVLAAIGPCIGADAFDVGPEVVGEFVRVFGEDPGIIRPIAGSGKARIDLKAAIRRQLVDQGVPSASVDVLPGCTVRDAELFFSHRRDQQASGRMVGVIGAKADGLKQAVQAPLA